MYNEQKISRLSVPGWEAVFRTELEPGVVAIIAIHDISLGRALGGCRMAWYPNESEALTDVLRLSRGMTFKNAIADLPLGGGKSVIICDPKISGSDRDRVLEAFGKFLAWVNKDNDRYYTAEDMNSTLEDMRVMARQTHNIFGIEVDPSPLTAWGVYSAIAASVNYFADDLFEGNGALAGKSVLVQGLGKVGLDLVGLLADSGAELYITDINPAAERRALEKYPNAVRVPGDQLLEQQVDIFAPCARGEVVTRNNLDQLRFKILCGAANNQLQDPATGVALHQRGIVYCPDYVANMGGVCAIQYLEVEKLSLEEGRQRISDTVDKMLELTFRTGQSEGLAYSQAVDHVVVELVWGKRGTSSSGRSKTPSPVTAGS